MAKCAKSRTDPRACENLRKYINKNFKQLPVKVSTVRCWIRTSRKKLSQTLTNYPVLLPTDWARTIFSYGGHFLLGGQPLDDLTSFQNELVTFWRNYQTIDPNLPFYREHGEKAWAFSIPIAVHGDEGRGKGKNPVMVIGMQPILPLSGKKTNMQGCLDHKHKTVFWFLLQGVCETV